MQISYDVSDWKAQYDQGDIRPANLDEAIDLMRESSVKPGRLATALIVGRELGHVNDDNLPSNKMANLMGTSLAISHYRSRQTARVQLGKERKETDVPRFVASPTIEDGKEATFDFAVEALQPEVTVVDYNDKAAAERAKAYLMSNVVGRIRDRLKLVALNSPKELPTVAKELKRQIDEIVKELS